MQMRHKGHNKWSNIRHIKGARDALLAKKYTLFTMRINTAVRENGGNNNPEMNSALKRVVNEALAQNVPKATLEKILKNSKNTTEESSELLCEIRGPGRVGVLVECLAKSRGLMNNKLNTILRKCASTQEKGISNMFDKKGVIVTDMKEGATLDDVETDAIEVEAEEVTLLEETNELQFTTGPTDLVMVSSKLVKAGYKCKDASISYVPNVEVSLSAIEAKALEKMIDMLMQEDIVTAVHCNAE